MNWTSPNDLRRQLSTLWNRGELLRPLVTGLAGNPVRLALRSPNSQELTDRFEAVRVWVRELAALPHIRIEWREFRHRVHGLQSLPERIWIDTLDDALGFLGKRRDADRLAQMVALTRATVPAALPWLARRPLHAIDLADRWSRLIAVVRWLGDHPRPGIYLRQVDIPGIDSKFIEAHRRDLSELLDLALPAAAIASEWSGTGQFAARYGFLDKPVRIRLRVLDESIGLLPGAACPDIALDAGSFAALDISAHQIFITENETNFLAFPSVPGGVVIFGAGYGWAALAKARWLTGRAIHYWGDIDTHGFAILDQLRRHFAHVSSFLMDRVTLEAHRVHWGEEPGQVLHDLPALTVEERSLFNDLRDNRIRPNLRLEQERVGFGWMTKALRRVSDDLDRG